MTNVRSEQRSRAWLFIPAASVVPALLDAGQEYVKSLVDGQPGIAWNSVVFQGVEWIFLGALAPITWFISRRVPFRRDRWKRVILAHAIGALVLCIGWASLGILIGRWLGAWMAQGPLQDAYFNWALTSIPWSVVMYCTVLGCVYAFDHFNVARDRELQASLLSTQLANARLGALRAQLHPHFLFNCLNTITVLVREGNNAIASRMLELLGDLLRELVRPDRPQLVTLSEELRFVRRYLEIEQVRFSDRLRVIWTIDSRATTALVPDLLLQPLVENAIHHGVARRADSGRIEIIASVTGDMLTIAVVDDGAGVTDRSDAEGVGLSNTRERLGALYGTSATLVLEAGPAGGTVVRITMPLRTTLA